MGRGGLQLPPSQIFEDGPTIHIDDNRNGRTQGDPKNSAEMNNTVPRQIHDGCN